MCARQTFDDELEVSRPPQVGFSAGRGEGFKPVGLRRGDLAAFGFQLGVDQAAVAVCEDEVWESDVALDVCGPAASGQERGAGVLNFPAVHDGHGDDFVLEGAFTLHSRSLPTLGTSRRALGDSRLRLCGRKMLDVLALRSRSNG